jgi:hypothetical protein
MTSKLRITYEDLRSPEVDQVLKRQAEELTLRMGMATRAAQPQKVSLIHKSWFYLMVAGATGAFIAWAVFEPYFDDNMVSIGHSYIAMLMLLSLGGLTGLMIGCMEGILARNFRQALKAGGLGFLIGFGGGFASTMVAGLLFTFLDPLGIAIIGREVAENPASYLSGFLFLVIRRSLIWAVVCMAVGLGPGIALKAKKLTMNGFLGGLIGGAIGGFLFDPINYIVSGGTFMFGAEVSRAIGFCVVGGCAGLMIGLVEMISKEAWLVMTEGPLKGKQFIIYRDPTVIGSSPRSEIYLFKDPSIEPVHAVIHTIRDGYEIEDKDTPGGTWINGQRIKRKRLMTGDEIRIGKAQFTYSERAKRPSA